MAVKLRMKMFGRTNRPEFRIVAADARSPRDGRIIENLGWYHPREKAAEKVLHMNEERIRYWLSQGAQPSETLVSIFKKRGIKIPWVDAEAVRTAKAVEARRAKKGKPAKAKAAKPAAAAKAAEAPKAAATAVAEAPKAEKPAKAKPEVKAATEEKAKAADSKAAKRDAKKAK